MNQPNNADVLAAEAGEGRERIKENTSPSHTLSTQREAGVFQGLRGVGEAARVRTRERYTALLHHLTVGLLRESFYALKRQAAPGVDGMGWREYEAGLEDRLNDLHGRVHRGGYPSKIRAVCVSSALYGSVRGAISDGRPYRDQIIIYM